MINPTIFSLKHEVKQLRSSGLCKPRMAIIMPTYICNQKCYYCFFRNNNNGHAMNPEDLFKTLKQLADFGIESIELCGGGEPLLYPKIEEIFEYAASLGLRLGLLTNGLLFKDSIASTFMKYGTYVRFSLDSVNPEMYKQIRGFDHSEIVKKNIEDAAKLKQKYDFLCEISIKIGMVKETTTESIQEIFDFAYGKRIYSIQLKNIWDERGNYYNSNYTRSDIFKQINTYGIKFVKKIGTKKKMRDRCWLSPIQVTVDAYGDVYLCCYYQYRENSHRIGNILEKPFAEIWGSDVHTEALRGTKIHECMKHDCRIARYMDQIRHQEKVGDWSFI